MKPKVKITKANHPKRWYAGKIGREFYVTSPEPDFEDCYIVDPQEHEYCANNRIDVDDCVLIQDKKELTVPEIQEKKDQLRSDLLTYINGKIEEFKQETKVSPTCIFVDMIKISDGMGKGRSEHILEDVSVKIEI